MRDQVGHNSESALATAGMQPAHITATGGAPSTLPKHQLHASFFLNIKRSGAQCQI
jgi:hypothetical protein